MIPFQVIRQFQPDCATKEQFESWVEAARVVIPLWGFCEDCTTEYQTKMIAQKRCVNRKFRPEELSKEKNSA